jgi:hypothetical protein
LGGQLGSIVGVVIFHFEMGSRTEYVVLTVVVVIDSVVVPVAGLLDVLIDDERASVIEGFTVEVGMFDSLVAVDWAVV